MWMLPLFPHVNKKYDDDDDDDDDDDKMWHLTVCKILVSFLDQKWNDLYHISELMLATLIQRYDKNFIFDPLQKTRDKLKFYRQLGASFYDCMNLIGATYIRVSKLSSFAS